MHALNTCVPLKMRQWKARFSAAIPKGEGTKNRAAFELCNTSILLAYLVFHLEFQNHNFKYKLFYI